MTYHYIPTEYKGYRFRSRTEARHAVFFDAIGLDWRYEREGYRLPSGEGYLPDFYLPSLECWLEVKGEQPTPRDLLRCEELSKETEAPVAIAWDLPFAAEYCDIRAVRPYSADKLWVWCCRKSLDSGIINTTWAKGCFWAFADTTPCICSGVDSFKTAVFFKPYLSGPFNGMRGVQKIVPVTDDYINAARRARFEKFGK